MNINNLDIKVATDYTAYTNTIVLQVAVPVNATDADALYKDIAAGDWSKTESDILAAVKKNAPAFIQTMVEGLLKAYGGGSAVASVSDTNPST